MRDLILLDTHIWVWWLSKTQDLKPKEVAMLNELATAHRLAISAISLWEMAMLVERKRILLSIPLRAWLAKASSADLVEVIPMSHTIAARTAELPESFHRDPADRIIVASCIEHGMPLCTRDERIVSSRLVNLCNLN